MESTSPAVHRGSAGIIIILRLLIGAVGGAITLVTFYLLVRRLSGALVIPLDFVPALVTGLLLSLGTWSLRRLAMVAVPEQPKLLIGICAVAWLLVTGLTLSGTSPLAGLALWLPVIATEAYWRAVPMESGGQAGEQAVRREENQTTSEVVQQLTRTREEGCERVSGTARIEFEPGEQTAAQHIAICPPLPSDPEVELETADADGVTIRATDCRSYGLRLEARRGRDTAEPLTVLVRFEAVST